MVPFMDRKIVILGGGGHALVVFDLLGLLKLEVAGYISQSKSSCELDSYGLAYFGTDEDFLKSDSLKSLHRQFALVNGIGSTQNGLLRRQVYLEYRAREFWFPSFVHPCAAVSKLASIGPGSVIMAGAVVQAGATLQENCIINTGATIDHHCMIGSHSHVAPGVTLSGGVILGENVHVGTGAKLIQGIEVGSDSLIGAGAVVIRDVPMGSAIYGVPGKQRHDEIRKANHA